MIELTDAQKQEKQTLFLKEIETVMKKHNLRLMPKINAGENGIFPIISVEEHVFQNEK